jgi:D-alanyl-D-alanine carboxypeptidase
MTDKALLAKIKDRLPPLATQQCKKAPGHLAIFVKRADNQQPLSGVQVNAKGPSSADGVTDDEGWIIFTYRNPGGYRADISLPEKLRTFRLPSATKNGTVPGCGTEIIEFDASPPKVGVALGFRAVLFRKDANPVPAAIKDFQVLTDNEFPASNHLLADGESQAVIQIELIKLNDKGKSEPNMPLAGPSEHFDEGNVVLELASADFGALSYAGKSGTKISVPVKDIRDGKSPLDKDKGVLFTTSRKIGEAKLTAKIENAKSYEYVEDFKRLRGSKELTLGSRPVGLKTNGYDGRKVQWFLRNAGFLAYKEGKLEEKDASCEWKEIKDIDVDGNFGQRSARCLRDFQRVARGSFRNQTVKKVTPTLSAGMSQQVTPEVIGELLEWRTKGYKVEPYNGFVHLSVTEGSALDEKARIVYGALVVLSGDDAKGYVEIKPTIGESACQWDGRTIVVADEIRCGIKLFEKDALKFRLHDADPGGPDSGTPVLEDPNLSPKLAEKLKATIGTLRREQKAADSGADCRDVRLYEGYRSVQRQESLYQKGRYRWTNAQGQLDYGKTRPNPVPASLAHTNGEPCKHGAETIALGTCLVHPHGNPQGQPCQHGAEVRPVATCTEHPWGNPPAQACSHPANEVRNPGTCYKHPLGKTVTNARGESRSSWHQYGLAVDLVFNNAKGQAAWPDLGNWDRNGAVGKANGLRWGGDWTGDDDDPPHLQLPQPPNDSPKDDPHRKKYNDTNGSELDKLKAVWSLF